MVHPLDGPLEATFEAGNQGVVVMFVRARGSREVWGRSLLWDFACRVAGVGCVRDLGIGDIIRHGLLIARWYDLLYYYSISIPHT